MNKAPSNGDATLAGHYRLVLADGTIQESDYSLWKSKLVVADVCNPQWTCPDGTNMPYATPTCLDALP